MFTRLGKWDLIHLGFTGIVMVIFDDRTGVELESDSLKLVTFWGYDEYLGKANN